MNYEKIYQKRSVNDGSFQHDDAWQLRILQIHHGRITEGGKVMRKILRWITDPLFWDVISAQHDEMELNHLYEKYGE